MNKSLLKNSETIQTSCILNTKVELKNANSMFLKQSNDPTENSAASCWNSCKKDPKCAASSFVYPSLNFNHTCQTFGRKSVQNCSRYRLDFLC